MSYLIDLLVMALVILLAFIVDSYVGIGTMLSGVTGAGGGS
jgi:hypothetical protein